MNNITIFDIYFHASLVENNRNRSEGTVYVRQVVLIIKSTL